MLPVSRTWTDSGHGDQKADTDLDEADGYDECACPHHSHHLILSTRLRSPRSLCRHLSEYWCIAICPVDWEESGYIMDDVTVSLYHHRVAGVR